MHIHVYVRNERLDIRLMKVIIVTTIICYYVLRVKKYYTNLGF